jgi:hypothetical protein
MHSSPTGELFLHDVRVPIEHFLGGPAALERALKPRSRDKKDGGGNSQAKGAFASERASIAATALGIIERCHELSVEYARTRVQFGQAIGQFQLIQDKLARMEVARFNVSNLVFHYVESLADGHGVTFAEASSMKLYSARAAVEVAMEAVQLHGGNGYMSEYPLEQLAATPRYSRAAPSPGATRDWAQPGPSSPFRVILKPAAWQSQAFSDIPWDRITAFCTFMVGVLGSSATTSMYRGSTASARISSAAPGRMTSSPTSPRRRERHGRLPAGLRSAARPCRTVQAVPRPALTRAPPRSRCSRSPPRRAPRIAR